MPPYGGADEEDYSSSDDDGSSYASTDEEFEAPPPPPPEDPPTSNAIVAAAPRDMVVHGEDDDDEEEAAGSDYDNDEERAMVSREPVETPSKQKELSPYNSDSAAAVAASTLAAEPQSLYHHTQTYQDPDEVAEELEITSSPTLKRLNKEEKAAHRKQWCHEKRYVLLGAVLLVLVAIAVALGVVFGANNSGSKSGGGSVNIPDDFPSQPDDFAGPSISSTAGDATDTSGGTAPSPTAPTDENISGPSPAPTDPRDPSLAALTDYLQSLETRTADGDSALLDPNSPQSQARNYVLTTLSQEDVDVLAALVKTGTEGNPKEGVQLRVGQLYGLATAFLSTDGDRWANRDGWMGNAASSATDPCGWNGVTCVGDVQTVTDLPGADMNDAGGRRKLSTSIASDRKTHIDDIQRRARIINSNGEAGNGRSLQQDIPPEAIIEIDLGENGLNGELPADFGTLFPYLRTLSMASNNLRGPLPETLFNGQTPDLQIVDLYDNNFSGSIAPDISNMNNLLVLGLGNNDIEGQIPASLPSSMQFLELGGNDMFGNIPGDAIGAMPDLENFAVSDNERLVGSIPGSMFDNKSKLLRLELDDCNFDGSIPPQIGQAQALNYINMNGNALLSGEIPEELYSLADLDTLLLYETAVSGSIIPSIAQLTNLSVLFLNDNNLSGPIPAEISNCKSLVELKLDDNNFTGGIPAEITTLPLLERLHIHNNPELRGEIPESIGDLVALRELILYSCGISGAVPDSIGELSNLVTLAINNNELSEITDKVEGLTSLQVLDLARNGFEKLPKNIGKLAALQELYLSSNRFEGQIDKGLSELTKLRRFYAENNFFSGDAPDFSKMVDLEELGLAYNKVVGDNKFPGFEGDLPNLGGLRSLSVVRLHSNSFEGELDANYGALLSLSELRLEDNSLEGPIPAFWGFVGASLEELTLFQNPGITGPMPAEICTLVESGSLDRLVVDCTVECTCCTDCFDG